MNKFILFSLIFKQIIFSAFAGRNCGVVPISKWAGEPSRRTAKLDSPVNLVVIQHTASPPCYTDSSCEISLRGIRDYQIKHLNFVDIGPSFLVGDNGEVYEGAGWCHVGAHTRGFNDKAIAISFIGDFTYQLPSPEALEAVDELLSCGVKRNYLNESYHLVGHRQLSATNSPGDSLQNQIKTWTHWTNTVKW